MNNSNQILYQVFSELIQRLVRS